MRRWSIGLAAAAWVAIVAATGLHLVGKRPASTPAALEAAVAGIACGTDRRWTGNRPDAATLAEQFERRLRDRKRTAFGGAGSPEELLHAHQSSNVHLQLAPDGACFLVHVIHDVAATRDTTLALAWRTAREVVGEAQGPEARLAVALRDDHGWLAIAAGRGADAAPPAGTVDDLAAFFGSAATTAAAATPGE